MEILFTLGLFALVSSITPGPNNLMLMSSGANFGLRKTMPHMLGVALGFTFMVFLVGLGIIQLFDRFPASYEVLKWFSVIYLTYLAYKIAGANITIRQDSEDKTQAEDTLTFCSGFLMQLLNPKAPVAILPIATVQFPAAGISGNIIIIWSVILATMAVGAPSVYMLMGKHLSRFIIQPQSFRLLNSAMALLLFYVAGDIAWNHVILKL